jgi:HSP20 family molecular chaperone IbpA
MAKKDAWLSSPFQLSQEVDRLFEELIHRPWGAPLRPQADEWNPELDLYETQDAFILEVDLPGVKETDVSVHTIDRNALAARVLEHLERRHFQFLARGKESVSAEWQRRSFLGRRVPHSRHSHGDDQQ